MTNEDLHHQLNEYPQAFFRYQNNYYLPGSFTTMLQLANQNKQSALEYKKWTNGYMNLPPFADEVPNLNGFVSGNELNEVQSLTIIAHLHEDENNYQTIIMVYRDDVTIFTLQKYIQDLKQLDSPSDVFIYNKERSCEDRLTLKKCQIKNNSILDVWFDFRQYDQRIRFELNVDPRIPFKDLMVGVADGLFGQTFYQLDLLAAATFCGHMIQFSEEYPLELLGIHNGSTIELVLNDKHGCFVPDTLVTMHNGFKKKIHQIEVGDMVMSFDYQKKIVQPRKVIYLHHGFGAKFIIIQTKTKLIKTTPNNPFLTKEGWKAIFPNPKLNIQQLNNTYDQICLNSCSNIYLTFFQFKLLQFRY